ncbi:hypothetical protein MMC06_006151 [Schaereria dolodes]|nr:hypothetical protein [Schaereria dolodes]
MTIPWVESTYQLEEEEGALHESRMSVFEQAFKQQRLLASVLPGRLHVTGGNIAKHVQKLQKVHESLPANDKVPNLNIYSTCMIVIGSVDVATKFFDQLGAGILESFKKIRIHVEKSTIVQSPHAFLRALQILANCSPPRRLEDIPLYFDRQPPIVSKIGRRWIGHPSFNLRGLLGLDIRIVVDHRKDEQPATIEDIESVLSFTRVDRPRVDFVKCLPPEIRRMVYSYLAPNLCDVRGPEGLSLQISGSERMPLTPKWFRAPDTLLSDFVDYGSAYGCEVSIDSPMLVCRQMSMEFEALIYGTCKFRCRIPPSDQYTWSDRTVYPLSRLRRFIQAIGSCNATLLRHLELVMPLDFCLKGPLPLRPALTFLASIRSKASKANQEMKKVEVFLNHEKLRNSKVDFERWERNLSFEVSAIPGLKLSLMFGRIIFSSNSQVEQTAHTFNRAIRVILEADLNGEHATMGKDGVVRKDGQPLELIGGDEETELTGSS